MVLLNHSQSKCQGCDSSTETRISEDWASDFVDHVFLQIQGENLGWGGGGGGGWGD